MSGPLVGVDTNLLVRLFLKDDERQVSQVTQLLDQASSRDPLIVNFLTVVETLWVLERRVKVDYPKARAAVQALLDSAEFHLPEKLTCASLPEWIGTPHVGLNDVLIATINADYGCDFTYTFDKRAARDVPGMELLA